MIISNTSSKLLDKIANKIIQQFKGVIVSIGLDGFCASGKTTLADELAGRLQESGRVVIRATSDDFMNPSEVRWKLGKDSPLGFYRDAIDFDSLERELLFPLSKQGNRRYYTSTYDIHQSRPNYSEQKKASADAILIFDGLFLQIPQLRDFWDMVIYVEASYETCILRAKKRNQEQLNSTKEIEQIYRMRYVPGFEIYDKEVNPSSLADFNIKTD